MESLRKKISTMMKRGAKLTKPIREAWVNEEYPVDIPPGKHKYAACALGAAAIGAYSPNGLNTPESPHNFVPQHWPWIMEVKLSDLPTELCPQHTAGYYTVMDTVIHLNDDEKWSRTRIAEWLDKVEDFLGVREEFYLEIPEEQLV